MLDHGLKIALLHQSEIAAPVPLPPAGRLLLTRDGGLQRDARTAAPQLQHGLAEVEVTPPGHTTDEMSVPTIVYLRQFPLQPPFQRQTTGIGLILPPWKFVRPVDVYKRQVYSSGGHPVVGIRISTRFVTDGLLSDDGKTVAVLTVGQNEDVFESGLDLYALDGDVPFASYSLGNNAILDLRADGSAFWALGESSLSVARADGSAAVHYDYAGRYLKDYALEGDGFSALLLGKYRAGSGAALVTVGADGQELASLDQMCIRDRCWTA